MSIDIFPELYELAGFFETEAEVSDRDVPWFYNRHIYRTTRENDKIYCAIEPGYGQIVLIWEKSGELVASLNLEYVSGLKLFSENGAERMVANFHESTELLDFELQLKPSIHIKWGNQANV